MSAKPEVTTIHGHCLLLSKDAEASQHRSCIDRALDAATHHLSDPRLVRDLFKALISQNSPYAVHLFGWVDYHRDAHTYRLKLPHDLRLRDGRLVRNARPNANAWFAGNERINDADVREIRLSRVVPWSDRERQHPAAEKPPKQVTEWPVDGDGRPVDEADDAAD